MSLWGPLVARARGLSSRLLGAETLRALSGARDQRDFAEALVRAGYLAFAPNTPPPDTRAIENAIRRVAARRYDILERWSRECGDVLMPLIEDEDRRSIRALVRGALGGIVLERRTAGLIPTSALPARAIDELALLNDIGAIGAALLALRHPLGAVVAEAARRERPDLFSLDQALVRTWAERAVRAARRADAALRQYVHRTIDLQNLWSARLIAEQRSDADADALFIPGGRLITLADLQWAGEHRDSGQLALTLAPRIRDTPLAAAVEPNAGAPDETTLDALLREFREMARRQPLGLAPVVLYVLRLRAEHRALLRVLWQLALGVPAAVRLRSPEAAA